MVNGSFELNLAERIESLKAGTLAALSVCVAFAAIALVNSQVLATQFASLASLQIASIEANLLISGAIAILAGFLFGVTYRYVIREDQNPHLKSGVVLAFGLVRGLAQVDVGFNLQGTLWPFGVLAIESICLFAIARLALDFAIQQDWVKQFNSN
ncbi:hypothetical protein H6F90_07270 [Trichocoleus sp. FACHB-591]|uniref:hypothetical protein n=1 Tax=Trichocoleus sp. FACHB-591 TaxID=2692872 RepID=UPI0016842C8E|nr:hypothetical protein [Trichocoleus sp. FACHB-591]MBD2094955.1 hypothetical protein [Trichocoleus sp. FACHB-591]